MPARIVRSTMVQHLLQKPRSSRADENTWAQRALVPRSLSRASSNFPAFPSACLVRVSRLVRAPAVHTFRDSPDPDSVQALMNPEAPGPNVAWDGHDEEIETGGHGMSIFKRSALGLSLVACATMMLTAGTGSAHAAAGAAIRNYQSGKCLDADANFLGYNGDRVQLRD